MARDRDMLTVRSGDVKLAVYVSGPRRAPPLILVHGYPDSAAVWAPIRARLAGRYRVIAYDVRGAGASDAPRHRADYALARLADDAYHARVEQAIVFDVEAWNANCPQHIPRFVHATELAETTSALRRRIAYLEETLRTSKVAFEPALRA